MPQDVVGGNSGESPRFRYSSGRPILAVSLPSEDLRMISKVTNRDAVRLTSVQEKDEGWRRHRLSRPFHTGQLRKGPSSRSEAEMIQQLQEVMSSWT